MISIGNITFYSPPIALAPLEDITDHPFRKICKEHGADLMYTEFIASDGLSREVEKSIKKMHFDKVERPIGIQIFGNKVESMIRATEMAASVKPDLIDLNFGCPVRKIVNKGGGAALLKDIPLMLEITKAVVKSTSLPVTAKTRLGWDDNNKIIVELAEQLQDCGIQALTIHGRTRAQMYKGEADWTLIGEVKNNPRMHIPIIGNGDVDSPEKAKLMLDRYGVDGLMIGRAAIGNPWIFKEVKHFLATSHKLQVEELSDEIRLRRTAGLEERIEVCRRHIRESVSWKGDERIAVIEMRKFFGKYFRGIPGFKPFKMRLMEVERLDEVEEILEDVRLKYNGNTVEIQ